MSRRTGHLILTTAGVIAFGVLMYLAGWMMGAHATAAATPSQLPLAVPAQTPPPLQELIPLPSPDEQLGRGQQQEGQDCQPIILFYHQGQLYQLMPGPQGQQGRPGSPPEYFPLRPYQGPQIPGLPFRQIPGSPVPQSPGFQPVNPRF